MGVAKLRDVLGVRAKCEERWLQKHLLQRAAFEQAVNRARIPPKQAAFQKLQVAPLNLTPARTRPAIRQSHDDQRLTIDIVARALESHRCLRTGSSATPHAFRV